MEEQNDSIWSWGGGAQLPPSMKRVEPWGWVCASLIAGAAAATATLLLDWRPLPLLAMPPGTLGEHTAHWAAMAVHALMPSLFEGYAARYASFWASLPREEQVGAICREALAVWAGLMPAVLLAGSMLEPRDGLIEVRGAKRIEGRRAAKALKAAMAKRVARRPGPFIAPNVRYPMELYARHVLVVGGVGSGKSTFLRPLVDQIAKAGEQILLFDAKSEFTAAYPGMAILAPWDARSLAWDIARDMRNELDMERFAAAVIKDSSDPVWANASRQILVGVMLSLQGQAGVEWGWAELRERLSLPLASLRALMETWHPIAVRSMEKASATSAGILINLMAFCSPIFHLAKAWGDHPPERRFSVVEWTLGRSGIKQVILQGHGGYPGLAMACAEGILGTFASLIASVEMSDDLTRKLWFVADEFAQLGKVPVMQLFSMGRGRGLSCVAAMQDFAQLETLYGASESKALIGMCGTIVVGQTMVGDTAKSLCDAFGTREVERRNVSTQGSERGESASLSFSRDEVPLYKPSELSTRLGLLPDGSASRLILFTGGVAYEMLWPVFDMPVKRRAHMPAMWTRGLSKAIVPDALDGPDTPDKLRRPIAADGTSGSPSSGGAVPSRSEAEAEQAIGQNDSLSGADAGLADALNGAMHTSELLLPTKHIDEGGSFTVASLPTRRPKL